MDAAGEDTRSRFELRQQEEYDAEMPLADREAKWGFTLLELQAATKVVGALFRNPSLFVGDSYLTDTRLYTMITRDRKSKRENREVYKAIMNEERSRRKRYQRLQDVEAMGRTVMKRERDEALNMLTLRDEPLTTAPLLLCDRKEEGSPACEDTTPGTSDNGLTREEKDILCLIGAFENLLRMQKCLLGDFYVPHLVPCDADNEKSREQLHTGAKGQTSNGTVDWQAVSQLNAQVYRYLPHAFGSQMPPPLWAGTVPAHATPQTYRDYIVGMKVAIARQAVQLAHLSCAGGQQQVNRPASDMTLPQLLTSTAEDAIVHTPLSSLTDCTTLRRWLSASGAAEVPATGVALTVTSDLLRQIEVVLLEGGEGQAFTVGVALDLNFTGQELAPPFTGHGVAEQSLNLFIARRLYQSERILTYGESPIVVDLYPPSSNCEEPADWCVFDDVQRYAVEHLDDDSLKLMKWRSCNVCKVKFNRLHPYYYSMCHLCGEFNYNKRLMARDLRGKVVLLTGCRIKIGYAMALSLLRCGATLLGTTRFAHEAVARFQQEPDYELWKERLHLFSLDLRDMWVVTQFCAFVRSNYPKVFAIINNAAQTIARTPQYTAHLREVEINPPMHLRAAIAADPQADEWHNFFLAHSTVTVGQGLAIEHHPHNLPFLPTEDPDPAPREEIDEGSIEKDHRGHLLQQQVASGCGAVTAATLRTVDNRAVVFDRYDRQAEESDHRESNSWVMKLADVQGSEAAEVITINALSPFIINGKLKPCLMNREGDTELREPRFIINVSAMEGQFYRFKQTTHPHTNMAKAALNMMTRTSAEDYAQDGIYMNSVDTGWITDESPKLKRERRAEQYMLCPLDEVDAAARCLDLIYTNSTDYGKFFKDYKEIPW